MSKAPDLSAFPIPRKGGARPIMGDAAEVAELGAGEAGGPEPAPAIQTLEVTTAREAPVTPQPANPAKGTPSGARPSRSIQPPVRQPLRLQPMGRPSPPP
jgi:hypothetical protein